MKELSKEKRKFLYGILEPYTKFLLLFVTIHYVLQFLMVFNRYVGAWSRQSAIGT